MSFIPASAMPHTYVHDEDDSARTRRDLTKWPANGVLIGGAAAVAYFLYRIFR